MKYLSILLIVTIFLTLANSSLVSGSPECSKGITFWCQHVMNAKKCNAVDFCIQTVWEKHLVQIDSNPLCDDCKEWVEQARDLIDKKEPLDTIIKTLEWSCEICPSKDECKAIIENNLHELQKIIVSKMNPDAVCSAVHFCNNKKFTEMFKNAQNQPEHKDTVQKLPFTCGQCNYVGGLIENNLKNADNDELLEGLLSVCGQMSSFSDSCSNLMLKNFNEIKNELPKVVNKQEMCHATCLQHHKYNNEGIIDIQPLSDDPEIACQMCEQLMAHLRELLIVNTTEAEFKDMLQGFCTQMPSVQDECVSIVEEYSSTIYKFLQDGLDADKTCVMIKMCKPKNSQSEHKSSPKMPLIASDLFPQPQQVDESLVEIHIVTSDSSMELVQNGALCTACEYTMQLIHLEMTKNTVHDKILGAAKAECKKLPQYVRQCEDMIEMFGDQILEAVDLGTNPRLVCPMIKMCPPSFDLLFMGNSKVDEKPTCPFCLFAMQEIKEVVSSNSTKESILKVLDGLCTHLAVKLQSQCKEFVSSYSPEVVDMIIADFTPQEACVFIKLCSDSEPKMTRFKLPQSLEASSESLDLVDFDDNTEEKSSDELVDDPGNPQCFLCKEVLKLVEEKVIHTKSKDEIRRELEKTCDHMKIFKKECKNFIDKFSDRIVNLIFEGMKPKKVCMVLLICGTENIIDMQDYDVGLDIMAESFNVPATVDEEDVESSTTCVLCEFIMTKAEEELNDKTMDEDVKRIFKNVCSKMPQTVAKECNTFIDYYFDMIIALIETTKPNEMCAALKLCPKFNKVLEAQLEEIKKDIYSCAVCRGVVDAMDTIIEDPQVDTKLEDLEEKICAKFAGKFKDKCHNLASTYGVAILNLLKNVAESDQICYKLELCPLSETSGMVKLI